MRLARTTLAVILSFALVALAPGTQAYAAAGKAMSGTNAAALPAPALLSPRSLPLSTPDSIVSVVGHTQISAVNSVVPGVGAATLSGPSARNEVTESKIAATALPVISVGLSPAAAASAGQNKLLRPDLPIPDFGKLGGAESRDAAHRDFQLRLGESRPGPSDESVRGFQSASAAKAHLMKGKDSMPDHPADDAVDGVGVSEKGATPDPDGTINPRRTDDGPDSVSDEFGGGSGNSPLFGFAAGAAGMLPLAAVMGGQHLFMMLASFGMMVASLVLHEMGHARAAVKLGDYGPKLEGRTGWSWANLKTHIDPRNTIVIPLFFMLMTGIPFGAANPVDYDASRFANPRRGRLLVTLAGPAVNAGLAVLGALAFAGLGALGAPGIVIALAASFATINVMLAVFNMMPVFPLDGWTVLRSLVKSERLERADRWFKTAGPWAYLPFVAMIGIGMATGLFGFLIGGATSWLLGGAAALFGLQLMGGMVRERGVSKLSQGREDRFGGRQPGGPSAAGPPAPAPVHFVVQLDGAPAKLTLDAHLSRVDPRVKGLYAKTQNAMYQQLSAAAIHEDELERFNATPVGVYKRINTATIRVDQARAAEFRAWLEGRGHKVFDNADRSIIRPVDPSKEPENADQARGGVSMQDNLSISRATKVHAQAKSRWGAPKLGVIARLAMLLVGLSIPQLKVGVIDTGVDVKHPMLSSVVAKSVKASDNGADDNGHGSWVASMILNFAPWLKGNLTSYRAFIDGGATLDDVLAALTMSANDGNVVISNSWGSDDGDPNSPDTQLVKKLASEGHIMVFAAGNAGPRANTIGSPAIGQVARDSGAIGVVSVAAADRNLKIAYFSSRGPGSAKTKDTPGYPHRPDVTAIGYNAAGAWPTTQGGADRQGPNGPEKDLSGTSMATPAIAGAIAILLMLFGITKSGKEADEVIKAIMSTLRKSNQGRDAEGEGFLDLDAAYEAAKQVLNPVAPSWLARVVLRAFARG